MKRALMYASVASMIQQFNMENIRLLLEQGYEVDVACNMEQGSTITQEKIEAMKQELESMGVNVVHIPIPRKVTAVGGIVKSFRASKQLMNERNYSLIHCHSPIGGMVCRLANRCSKGYGKAKMIYTAHGFHFYKGAPKKNWLMFYPVEWFCSRYTDVLITINQEDYTLAKRKMKAKQSVYVPGVGVDIEKFKYDLLSKEEARKELGLSDGDKVLLSVGELSVRKNHEVVIRALAKIDRSNCKYFICGLGSLQKQLEKLISVLHMESCVKLLGYRSDIARVLNISDIYIFPSLQEGLPVALMESMAAGKAVACSKIRGNTDLIDENGGVLFNPRSVDDCAVAIEKLLKSDLRSMGEYNAKKIHSFSKATVNEMMVEVYLT